MMVYLPPRYLLAVACLIPQIVCSSEPAPPSSTDEVICPTDSTDCYPRLFEPTEHFQIIKEGQDIPPGLHVRMNIYSGEREARLNIPMEGAEGYLPEDATSEQAIVIVDQPDSEQILDEQAALRDSFPHKPPPYDPAGAVNPPSPQDSNEIGTFQTALIVVGVEGRSFDKSLSDLSELAHDIYYGVEIAKNGPVLEKLVCLTLGQGSEKFPANKEKRDYKAASILSSAIQNNPTAVKEISTFSRLVMYPSCGTEAKKGNFVSILRSRLGREKDPQTLKAKITAVSGLLREPAIQGDFLHNGGMELLLAIWLKKGEQWDVVRRKVAQLVMDNFLDESMGATLGVWPKKAVAEAEVCEKKGSMLEDGCWEHHVRAFLRRDPDSPWAKDLVKALGKQRKKSNPKKEKDEL